MARETDTLGGRLRLARNKRRLTQDELADLAAMKQPDISKLERGDMLKTTGMARLVAVLRVPAAWLELGLGDEPLWDAAIGEPPAPPSDYRDRHEVSESDWATLQAVKMMLSEQELADIRERAARAFAAAEERIAAASGKR